MSERWETIDDKNEKNFRTYNRYPDTCPFCHHSIKPIFLSSFIGVSNNALPSGTISSVILQCPRNICKKIFIAEYTYLTTSNEFRFIEIIPTIPREIKFSNEITTISPDFISIYNQSYTSEQYGLNHVSGPGYRKSLEFLIKDYAIRKTEDEIKKNEIPGKFLGNVINEYIDDKRIKAMAKRAAWLGNDETHFFRKWEGKDIDELKTLIELTVKWIEMVELSDKYVAEMPDD